MTPWEGIERVVSVAELGHLQAALQAAGRIVFRTFKRQWRGLRTGLQNPFALLAVRARSSLTERVSPFSPIASG